MAGYLEAFILGNAAIISNVCVLPLYPGLLAFLAGQEDGTRKRGTGWLGFLVLAGVLSLMLIVGVVLFALRQTVSALLPWLLPTAYLIVLILGILLIAGFNPFAKLSSSEIPLLRNPYITAYCYGLLLGPLTLPCTGPLVISAFVLGAGDATALTDGILYFLAFGLGFGWPLVALSWVAAATGRQLALWVARRSHVIHRLSGVILVGIALFGFWTDIVPNLRPRSASAALPQPVVAVATSIPEPDRAAQIPAPLPTTVPQPTDIPAATAGPSAPELTGITHWINSEPLTLAALRGKVVLVHFWTFGCYNCKNTLPYVTEWYNTYQNDGFTVLGIHAPEFGYEKETDAVVEAAKRHGINYPIAQDNDFATWKAYDNHYWPALYLIDKQGQIRYHHIGEGAYEETEALIQELLAE